MNKKTRRAILKILLLQEEFSKKELDEAVRFLSDNTEKDIIKFLSIQAKENKVSSKSQTSFSEQTSKAVLSLKGKDQEKYEILRNFDSLLRKGELLSRLDSIKKFGAQFSKEFDAGKSRAEAIPKLISLLSDLDIDELKLIIKDVLDESGKESSEYAELANFLIKGRIEKGT